MWEISQSNWPAGWVENQRFLSDLHVAEYLFSGSTCRQCLFVCLFPPVGICVHTHAHTHARTHTHTDSNLNPVLKLLISYTGHPSYTLLAETFRNQIFSMPRPPICRTSPQQQQQQLTEREWFEYARRIWITLKKSDLLTEYERILEDSSPN